MEQKRKNFKIGEQLKIITDEKKFKLLQDNCKGYSKLRMCHLLGSYVKVKHFTKYEVIVEKRSVEYFLHPDSFELNIAEENCLFEAINNENEEKILSLIENDNLNIQDNFGKTPFHFACFLGKINIVKLLWDFEPDLEIPDNEGNLPIHTCIIMKHYDIFQFLIEVFPKFLKSKTSDGKSLKDLVLFVNDQKMLEYLANKEEISNDLQETRNIYDHSISNELQEYSGSTFQTIKYSSEKQDQIGNSLLQNKPEELICQICTVDLIKIILQCGHVLCRNCFKKVLFCPFDREQITFSTELIFND